VEQRHAALGQVVSVSGLLGYLNFSDGRPDPRWQKQINDAFAHYAQLGDPTPWLALLEGLNVHTDALHAAGGSAFRDVSQARAVLDLVAQVLPAYRQYHADLLAHLRDDEIFGPFFLARVAEAVLVHRAQGRPTSNEDVPGVLARLNDFVGHRPVAILETRPQGEPYEHERHRPLPLYLRGVGVAYGPYHDVVAQALEILGATDPNLLTEAAFDPALLDEMALDLRAYDHGHPVNRRPNYVFGEWDPHHLDNQGRFRRYVLRKITLDGLMERVVQPSSIPQAERLAEGAAVLAGTILMATGISGYSPTAHDSVTTLATLLPRIARYRDTFYQQLLARLGGTHAARLRQEQTTTRQPFGAARQDLNARLARHRASQLQQRYLALLFAEMGYPRASQVEARRIPAVSVRLLSEILGRLTSGAVDADHGRLRQTAEQLPEVEALLQRGIGCGGLVDPWNILGFQGLFPLSPAREDAIRDPRVEELIQLVEQTFNLHGRLMCEAAATGETGLVQQVRTSMEQLAAWWDRFATSEVSAGPRPVNGSEAIVAAGNVARSLLRWHQRGETAADLGFWRGQLDSFRSPGAFAGVIETLLRKNDGRAAAGLLISWVGSAEQVPLEEGPHSFHNLALRWILDLTRPGSSPPRPQDPSPKRQRGEGDPPLTPAPLPERERGEREPGDRVQALLFQFFGQLEANAEDYWQVPALELPGQEEPQETEDLYEAAYEDVTYRDSTEGDEGAVSDGGGGPPPGEFDLEEEGERLEKRLRFLSTVARLWQVAARFLLPREEEEPRREEKREDTSSAASFLIDWLGTASQNARRLLHLLDAVHGYDLPEPSGDYDSLVEYDRRRVLKEQLLYTIIGTCLDTALAVSALRGAVMGNDGDPGASGARPVWEPDALRLERALFKGDSEGARAALTSFLERFQAEPLLFTPLTEGGAPRQILRVRLAQTVLRALLANLPRLGLLRETYELLRTARTMEQNQTQGVGRGRGVTEFNHFFQSAYQAVVESVVRSSATWSEEEARDEVLVELLERLTAPFLALWIEHSRTLQLSILEGLTGDSEWRALQAFVQRYGGELFHARFMTLANLRGILHRGVESWLDYLRDNPDPLRSLRLMEDLGQTLRREDAVRRLELVMQAVVENYEEYKDYNTTTTQSDYGENLHVLLDFLRVKVAYERNAWQFRPLVMAHEVLARHGRPSTAVRWERSLTQFTRDLARQHLERLGQLERQHGVHLSTISDRLNERFVKPLALDRLCALIEPCVRQARSDPADGAGNEEERPAFVRLQQELEAYTASPSGVGLDVPAWLRRLEAEVHRVQAAQSAVASLAENFFRVPRRAVGHDELRRQLGDWERPSLPRP
jgi:hypothetical protein